MDIKITCGRCQSKFEVDVKIGEEIKCPLCGFSKKDISESIKDKKLVLKG